MCEPVSQLWTTWIILGTSSITSQLNVNTHLYHHLYSISSSLHHHLYHHLSCHHRHNTTTGIYQCCVNGRVYQLMVKLLANHISHHTIQLLYHWNKWGRSCDIELELTKKYAVKKTVARGAGGCMSLRQNCLTLFTQIGWSVQLDKLWHSLLKVVGQWFAHCLAL